METLDGRAVVAYTDGSRFEGFYSAGKRHGPGRWIIAGLQPGEIPYREADFENGVEKVN